MSAVERLRSGVEPVRPAAPVSDPPQKQPEGGGEGKGKEDDSGQGTSKPVRSDPGPGKGGKVDEEA